MHLVWLGWAGNVSGDFFLENLAETAVVRDFVFQIRDLHVRESP